MSIEDIPQLTPHHNTVENEPGEVARVEILGDVDPRTLTPEEFETQATLFHGSRNPEFRVKVGYGLHNDDIIDDATLGTGLYTTSDKQLAQDYAELRENGVMVKLMPYQARMLNLTSEQELINLPFPRELFEEWVHFSHPRIDAMLEDPTVIHLVKERLYAIYQKMHEIRTDPNQNRSIDLRGDILDTSRAPFTMVDAIWRDFCASKGWDGIIYVEGGSSGATRKHDRTHIFYNTNTIGTYDDWQEQKE